MSIRVLNKLIITEFRGRGDEVHMYPFVLGFETADQKSDFLKSLFEETLKIHFLLIVQFDKTSRVKNTLILHRRILTNYVL